MLGMEDGCDTGILHEVGVGSTGSDLSLSTFHCVTATTGTSSNNPLCMCKSNIVYSHILLQTIIIMSLFITVVMLLYSVYTRLFYFALH